MDVTALINTVITLFLLLAAGFIMRKLKLTAADETGVKRLSSLILTVAQPALIISSLTKNPYSPGGLRDGLIIIATGMLVHAFFAVFSYFLVKPLKNRDERKLSELLLILTNCGFIGFPILQAVMGDKGLFWGSFYFISFHTCTWTWGIAVLGRGRSDIKITLKKVLVNLGTIPCLIGLLLFISRLPLPVFLTNTLSYLGSLCTPVSMLVTGAILADLPLRKLLLNPKIHYLNACKLILIPLTVCLLSKLIGIPHELAMFITIISALPSASIVSMLAVTYDIEPGYAAQAVGLGPIFMVVTLPAVMFLANIIL